LAANVEVKARVSDLASVRAKAQALATEPPHTINQRDTFFVVPSGRLKVRAFEDGSGELIAYERRDHDGPRLSTYSRVACPDARGLSDALSQVLPVRGVVVKHREVFLAGRTRIHLDRVEGLGCFVELEVVLTDGEPPEVGDAEARRLLRALEIPERALVAAAYIDLFERRYLIAPERD
jgi:adenylate cyclase class IV